MWKQLLDYGKQLVALNNDVQQGKTNDRKMQEEIDALEHRVDVLTDIMKELTFELRRQRDNAERDRKILLLQLENTLFRHERGLPPGSILEDKPEGE